MSRFSFNAWICAGCVCFLVAGCSRGGGAPDAQVASSETMDESMDYEEPMGGSTDPASASMTTGDGYSGDYDSSYMDEGCPEGYGQESYPEGYGEEMYPEGYGEEMYPEGYGEEMYPEGYGEETYPEGYGEDGYMEGPYGSSGPYGGRGAAQPVTYMEHAQRAFQQGDDTQAIRYLMAHVLTSDDEQAKTLLDQMGFNSHIRRPTFAVRWGVGIEFTPPKGYMGSIFPIGTQQNIGGKPGRAGLGQSTMESSEMGGPGRAGAASGGSVPVPQSVRQLTGELGQTIVEQFMVRLKRGDYGQVLQTMDAPRQGTTGGYSSGYSDYESGYDEYGSDYGSGGGQMLGGMGSGAGARASGAQGPQGILPGVTFLAIGNSRELVAKAKEAGVDVLCVFRVSIKLNPRVGLVTNETSLAIFDVGTGKETFGTRPLNNISVQRNRAEGKPDNVDTTLRALFEHVDENWRLGPLPELKPDQVLERLRELIRQPSSDDPLAALTEARLYHSRGLLQDDHLTVAFRQLLGDDQVASTLLTGTEEERKAIVDNWVRPATAAPSATGPRDILQGSEP